MSLINPQPTILQRIIRNSRCFCEGVTLFLAEFASLNLTLKLSQQYTSQLFSPILTSPRQTFH
jgi:hypothetical protein